MKEPLPEQCPASADKLEAEHTAKASDGFNIPFAPATGNKKVSPDPVTARAEVARQKTP